MNAIRRAHPALQRDAGCGSTQIDDERLIAYTKATDDRADIILTVVILDPATARSGTLTLDLDALGIAAVTGRTRRSTCSTGPSLCGTGRAHHLTIDPTQRAATILELRQRTRSERQFEHFLG